MSYFATPYTIHFDDTMAYGSHHFLTAFKFQCAARESLLYGDRIFDQPDVPDALDKIHLFTADAYSRNLSPASLGDRLAILITLEEWGRVSARFCYRVVGQQGQPICAGFQTMICSDAQSGQPIPLPESLRSAFDALRDITEPIGAQSFRDRVLAGTESTLKLFTDEARDSALLYLTDRYPQPRVLNPPTASSAAPEPHEQNLATPSSSAEATAEASVKPVASEVWVFPGQGAFDAGLLSHRIADCTRRSASLRRELDAAADIAAQRIGGDGAALCSGSVEACRQAVNATPNLSQVGIFLQSVLGAQIRQVADHPAILMGHSFGEIAALCVSGCCDLPTGVRIVCERVRAITDFAPHDGSLLVAATNRQYATEEIAVLGLPDVVVAGRNHDRQTVISGPRGQLDQLRRHLKDRDVDAIPIASPTSFHHPSLRKAAVAWFDQLQDIPLKPISDTVYSPIGRRLISADDDIPTVLSSQFLRPFDLQGAIDDLVAGGFTRFVDCGSSGSLARLLKAAGPESIEVECVADLTPTPSRSANAPAVRPDGNNAERFANLPQAEENHTASRGPGSASARQPAIAIVARGCLLPGGATSPAELHAALTQGREGIFDQRERDAYWEHDFYSSSLMADKSTSPLAGLVNDRDIVRPNGIDPAAFCEFSRTQQLLCVALAPCLDALRQAESVTCLMGTTADGFQDQDYLAALRYAEVNLNDAALVERLEAERAVFQDPYAAIREVLDQIVRPGMELTLVDAACASSLYSVALGMRALEDFETDVVLAGGVFCPGPGNNCLFSQFGGLTSTGCRPFDAEADGVVFSEGAAVVVLRRLADARQAGQPVAAIIRGVGLSSDGRSSSANVPQSAGQLLALERCYANYDIDPNSIVAVECHGTSTPVGDATELKTLHQFFADHADPAILLHSLKGLLGHTGWAAGTAAMIAASEMLNTGVFPAQAGHRQPSAALVNAQGVLQVPPRPVDLGDPRGRLAIDGFGFGGSNAHLVIESDQSAGSAANELLRPQESSADDELVVVAWHQLRPTRRDDDPSDRFDRDTISLPQGVVLLPDLADDMDVSQSLALSLVGEVLSQIGDLDDALRQQTGLVLAQGGKTERAIEATARVLAPRLLRDLADLPAAELVKRSASQARPSGPYTLQCMMPNVSAGRAALQFNLNGPNFVVDAGAQSLEAAFRSADLLLRGGDAAGTQLVVVAAIHANRWPVPQTNEGRANHEYAAAFAVTTRRQARLIELEAICPVESIVRQLSNESGARTTTEQKIAACVRVLKNASQPLNAGAQKKSQDTFPIHTPVWVETPLPTWTSQPQTTKRWLVLAEADEDTLAELLADLPSYCERQMVVLVGPVADVVASRVARPDVVPVDLSDEKSVASALDAVREFAADLILALNRDLCWNFSEVLQHVARNELCELLFLAMQQMVPALRSGETEIWAVLPGAWRGLIHPATGALSGLIKSGKREFPAARLGVISHDGDSISDALRALQRERATSDTVEPDVVYEGNKRLVRRLRALDVDRRPTSASHVALNDQSVVVASGGARGVTAVLAESLLRNYGCTLIAFGRSPLEQGPVDLDAATAEQEYYERFITDHPDAPPVVMKQSFDSAWARWEAQRTIDALSSMQGCVRYLTVDVTNRDEVDRAIDDIVNEFGRVDLIIHGAGVQWSKKLEDRSLSEFRRTFDVKVNGLKNLVEGYRQRLDRSVPVHVLTSAYSIFGNDGQHDYGAANETMDRLCGLTELESDEAWSSIAWSAWDGIGMTRGSEYRALAEKRNLALLDRHGGQQVFQSVIEGKTKSSINVPLSDSERTRYEVRTLPPSIAEAPYRTGEFPVRLDELDCLAFHKARGVATLPGAWIVDYMTRAVQAFIDQPAKYVTVENMRFLRMVRVANEHDPQMRVIVDAAPDGYHAWLIGDVVSPNGVTLSRDRVFAQATISTKYETSQPRPALNGLLKNGHGSVRTVHDPYCAGAQNVELSGPFNCLPHIEIGPLGRRAIFSPHERCDWGGRVPALLLDAALRVAGMHVVPDALHVPTRMDRVVLPTGISTDSYAAAGWQIRTCSPSVQGDKIRCDRVEVTDQNGDLQLCVEGAWVTQLR